MSTFQHGKHKLEAYIGASTVGVLTELIRSGAGADVGDVIDKMTLEILPQWRQLQYERSYMQQKLAELTGVNESLRASVNALTAETQQLRSQPGNCKPESREELPGGGESEDDERPGFSNGKAKRFFKPIHELDPSARRKRKAKFLRSLLALTEQYGIEVGAPATPGATDSAGTATLVAYAMELRDNSDVRERHEAKRAKLEGGALASVGARNVVQEPVPSASAAGSSVSLSSSSLALPITPALNGPPANQSQAGRKRHISEGGSTEEGRSSRTGETRSSSERSERTVRSLQRMRPAAASYGTGRDYTDVYTAAAERKDADGYVLAPGPSLGDEEMRASGVALASGLAVAPPSHKIHSLPALVHSQGQGLGVPWSGAPLASLSLAPSHPIGSRPPSAGHQYGHEAAPSGNISRAASEQELAMLFGSGPAAGFGAHHRTGSQLSFLASPNRSPLPVLSAAASHGRASAAAGTGGHTSAGGQSDDYEHAAGPGFGFEIGLGEFSAF